MEKHTLTMRSGFKKKIPTYDIQLAEIDSDTPAVNCIAFVDSPAIGIGWQAFSNQEKVEYVELKKPAIGALFYFTKDGKNMQPVDGDYRMKDKSVIQVKNGFISAIKPAPRKLTMDEWRDTYMNGHRGIGAPAVQKFGIAYTKDGATLSYEGVNIAVGKAVFVLATQSSSLIAKGDKLQPADGAIAMEDGTVVTVNDGKVAEITQSKTNPAKMSNAQWREQFMQDKNGNNQKPLGNWIKL